MRHELETLAKDPYAPAVTAALAAPPIARPIWKRALTAALAGAAVAGGIVWRLRPDPVVGSIVRFTLYTPGPGAFLISVQLSKGAGLGIGEVTTVARPFTNAPPIAQRTYDTSPKLTRMLGLTGLLPTDSTAQVGALSVVVNWFEEVRQKVK